MNSTEQHNLITRNLQEVIGSDELQTALDAGEQLKHYIGFEISGKVHLGTGLVTGSKIADFQKAGVKCSCYLATYHAWINNKLGGDLDTIRKYASYFEEGLRGSIKVMGGDPEKMSFVHGDDLYHNNDEYWRIVLDVAKNMTLNRSLLAITIMGRKEGEGVSTAQLIYPAMQVADIFIQGLRLTHAGMDQRKAHALAREVAFKLSSGQLKSLKGEPVKPIALHHPLLQGLQSPPPSTEGKSKEDIVAELKMSKSVKGSAVFVTDSPEEIRQKLQQAYCPAKIVELNPVLQWTENIIFRSPKASLLVERPAKFGGQKEYSSFIDVQTDFASGTLHPLDLKKAVGEQLITLLEPVRKPFLKGKLQKLHEELDALITR